jgi:alpha-maltose-1-phosphate synthase
LSASPSILLAHPTGNANVRQAALALAEAGILAEFQTCLAPNASALGRWIEKLPGSAELRRRHVPAALIPFTKQRPHLEAARLLAARAGFTSWITHETGFASVDAVYRDLDAEVSRNLRAQPASLTGVYCYEDGALQTFRTAKELGIATYLETPTAHWRFVNQLCCEEGDRLPGWSGTLPALRDSPAKLARKDEELCLADHIIVPSEFTKATLFDVPFSIASPRVVPYGCPPVQTEVVADDAGRESKRNPLRVLFVGGVTQLKGMYELFRAAETLKDRVSLTIVGNRVGQSGARDEHLSRHRWIPSLSNAEVLGLMEEHDVFVFPSLSDGFGLVVGEALSQGLPVIATAHAGASTLLSHGRDGFIVPIRDWEAIATHLETLDKDRELLSQMRQNAFATATRNSWSEYRRRLIEVVSQQAA